MSEAQEKGSNIPAPISSSFCSPTAAQFKIVVQAPFCGDGTYQVQDLQGNLLLKFFKSSFLCCNQVVYDANGDAVVSLKRKMLSLRGRWDAYRGKKKKYEPEDLLFSMERVSLIPWKLAFRIRLPGNESDDFTLTWSCCASHSKIYHNGAIIAEADMKRKFLIDRELIVSGSAGVDQAFLASILVIHRKWRKCQNSGGGG
ncbi:hypothetical protein R1flu_011944 [Riccia fluitans]|uniref:Uncharacterized protein n=1 Tax=Riccia fluitans TaxID=41844 RepID=A0ABD1ZDD5_9MARC